MIVTDAVQEYLASSGPGPDPVLAERLDRMSPATGNVEGIMHWLDKTAPSAS